MGGIGCVGCPSRSVLREGIIACTLLGADGIQLGMSVCPAVRDSYGVPLTASHLPCEAIWSASRFVTVSVSGPEKDRLWAVNLGE